MRRTKRILHRYLILARQLCSDIIVLIKLRHIILILIMICFLAVLSEILCRLIERIFHYNRSQVITCDKRFTLNIYNSGNISWNSVQVVCKDCEMDWSQSTFAFHSCITNLTVVNTGPTNPNGLQLGDLRQYNSFGNSVIFFKCGDPT